MGRGPGRRTHPTPALPVQNQKKIPGGMLTLSDAHLLAGVAGGEVHYQLGPKPHKIPQQADRHGRLREPGVRGTRMEGQRETFHEGDILRLTPPLHFD